MGSRIREWVRRHPIWSAIIALLVVGLAYLMVRPTPPTYEYVPETVDVGEVTRKVTASGKLRALNTIKVGAEVSGQVTRVYVDFNSPVSAGQLLAEIDPTRLRARVQQAQAQVALAQASLAQAEAAVVRSQTDLAIQGREFGRRSDLERTGFVSKSGLDNANSLLAGARAAARTATAQVASARAQISQSMAELSSAQLDLRRARILAPASGVVINKLVEPGTTVAANFQTPNLFEIAADTTRMQVEASVDEADIGQIVEGQSVKFNVDAYPGEDFAARVDQIRKAANENQNVVSYLVILGVDNSSGRLLPGMTANVEIITGSKTRVTRVPTAALRFRPREADRDKVEGENAKADKGEQTAVYVASADPLKPKRRVVRIGLQGEDHTEIVSGLKANEKVIVRSRSLVKKKVDEESADEKSDE
jgi:HlyD family secretion protein